jgi:hypothetical protein
MSNYRDLFDDSVNRDAILRGQVENAVQAKNEQSLWDILKRFVKNLAIHLLPFAPPVNQLVAELVGYAKQKFSSYNNWRSPQLDSMSTIRLTSSTTGAIESVWVDHDVQRNGMKGKIIHAHFSVQNMNGLTGSVGAYFYFGNDQQLIDFHNSHHNEHGHVCVTEDFTPRYRDAIFDDFPLFMPYSACRLLSKDLDLYFYVSLYNRNTQTFFAHSNAFLFTFNY